MVQIYEMGSKFTIGKGNVIKEGTDVTIVATGIMVAEGIKAVEMLKEEGISARLVDMFTIKPIDEQLLVKCAKETGAIVTAENHNVIGGLGSAVCEVLAGNYPVCVEKVGVYDTFGEVGPIEFLQQKFHLTAADIVTKASYF
jgi:transketolase